MTIQEYKNTLQCWLTTFADCGVTTDAMRRVGLNEMAKS